MPGSERSGRYVARATGYRAFIPAPLPPHPPVRIDADLLAQLSLADQALGRLDGISPLLPNPDLFVSMYVRREAVLSSQIEGTRSTLEDVLTFELDPSGREVPPDIGEVVNYIRAMNHGLARLATLPLSLRLIREIHAELLSDVEGAASKRPGAFRESQNWIGPAGITLARATYVPPPVAEMHQALDNLERFLHAPQGLPALLRCGIVHAQFEMIHPFLDGNGRVGRLLNTLLLVHGAVLHQPLLYLSLYLKRHQAEYYARLRAVHDEGDWEGWLLFFLRGVRQTAHEATETAVAIVTLREQHRLLLHESNAGRYSLPLLDLLFRQPLVHVPLVQQRLGIRFKAANTLVAKCVALCILEETTGGQRNRRFRYTPYLDLFQEEP